MKKKYKFILIILLLTYIILQNTVFLNCIIPSKSMEPTLNVDDRLLGSRIAYKKVSPIRNDIIVFKHKSESKKLFIKRIIGLPGETIEIKNNAIYINNEKLESYGYSILEDMKGNYGPYLIPDDSYFVLGDNRNNSLDSRFWDDPFVKKDEIKAKILIKYWPISDFTLFY